MTSSASSASNLADGCEHLTLLLLGIALCTKRVRKTIASLVLQFLPLNQLAFHHRAIALSKQLLCSLLFLHLASMFCSTQRCWVGLLVVHTSSNLGWMLEDVAGGRLTPLAFLRPVGRNAVLVAPVHTLHGNLLHPEILRFNVLSRWRVW